MSHKLRFQNPDRNSGVNVTIVGAGGTGGFVAESMCRLMTGTAGRIVIVDHDRVERHNILRQNFYERDIGLFKAEALANRLARNYGRPIDYCTTMFEGAGYRSHPGVDYSTGLMIGCVDNAEARQEMANATGQANNMWWIDAGNGKDWGQIAIGNCKSAESAVCSFTPGWCTRLPRPTDQFPDLLTPRPPDEPDIDCAAAILLSDQDPTINQTMATLTVSLARQVITGTAEIMNLHVDQEHGTVTPTYATPENVAQILGVEPETLLSEHGADEACERCGRHGRR